MNTVIKTKFLKTSELYFKKNEHDVKTLDIPNIAELMFLEKKMSNRFLHNTKSVLLDRII